MNINILTLFPEMFKPFIETSIMGRAVGNGIFNFNLINIRDFSENKHKKVDDYPFGGGQGMLMSSQPIFSALESIENIENQKIIYMSPRGKVLDKEMAQKLSEEKNLTILCGHYEGVDQRVLEYWDIEEISIGDYVMTGGELPAMVLIDTVSRLVEGVLPKVESAQEESIYSGLLEYPQYTKPREFRGMDVPEVLLNGNHKMIDLWKYREALILTKKRRPDIFNSYLETEKELDKDRLKILNEVEKI